MTQKRKAPPGDGRRNQMSSRMEMVKKARPAKGTRITISAQEDLFALFDLGGFAALANAPSYGIGGDVFIMEHRAGSRRFFSINQTSESGTGWQSLPIAVRDDAIRLAGVLVDYCEARPDARGACA